MINTIKLEFTRLQIEIFRLLCQKSGEKINQSQIATQLNVSSVAVSKAIPHLIKKELVLCDKNSTMNLVQLQFNANSKHAIRLKRADNLRVIYESKLLETLEPLYAGCTIVLFGSYARGEDTAKSDIDIVIIGAKDKKNQLLSIEKSIGKTINISFFENLDKIKKELKESIFNGIVLSGGIEL